METRLASWVKDSADGQRADEILRACVHCGFCLATCPTYQLLGDELDSPRGRIYQIKQVLENAPATREHQMHLDRCLTCRSCETTCPSGVEYGHLVDIGRAVVDAKVRRPARERALRWVLREGLTRRGLFTAGLRVAQLFRWALPENLRAKLPQAAPPPGSLPARRHARKVLLLNGCVQPALAPSIDAATARVLDAVAVQCIVKSNSGCCGAIRHHLSDPQGALQNARRNIDAWWPEIDSGNVQAIVMNASGCAAMVREYGQLLKNDPHYAARAARVVELTCDLSEFLAPLLGDVLRPGAARRGQASRVAFHPPCTLQHGMKIRGVVEKVLMLLGAELLPVSDAHLCCGSAGTYSLLQTDLSQQLRSRKLDALLQNKPEVILSANIGCISHLQGAAGVPVRHWIEWVDERLSG